MTEGATITPGEGPDWPKILGWGALAAFAITALVKDWSVRQIAGGVLEVAIAMGKTLDDPKVQAQLAEIFKERNPEGIKNRDTPREEDQ